MELETKETYEDYYFLEENLLSLELLWEDNDMYD